MIQQEALSNVNIQQLPIMGRENHPEEQFVSIHWQNNVYRVPNNHYYHIEIFVTYLLTIIGLFAISFVVLIIFGQMQIQFYPCIITIAVGYIPINIWFIHSRIIKDSKFIWSLLSLNVYLIIISVLFTFGLGGKGPLSMFFAILMFILSQLSIQNGSKIFIVFTFLVEFGVIGFKIDDHPGMSWTAALCGLIIIFSILALISFLLLLYTVSYIIFCRRHSNFIIKSTQLMFNTVMFMIVTFLTFLPIWSKSLNKDYQVIAYTCIILSFATIIIFYNKKSLILLSLFDNPLIVKQKDLKLIIQLSESNKLKNLYKISQTWFINCYNKDICYSQSNEFQCLVCMNQIADIVWMPCGHCTTCEKCCFELINKKIIQCTICKQKPKFIAKILRPTALSDQINSKNEYNIQATYNFIYK